MAKWLDEITIHQFRGITNLTLAGLSDVNILVGENNSGKTSILEAIAACTQPFDLYQWTDLALRREVNGGARSSVEALRWLFPQIQASASEGLHGQIHISIAGKYTLQDLSVSFEEIYRLPEKQTNKRVEKMISETSEREMGAKLIVSLRTASESHSRKQEYEVWDTQNQSYSPIHQPSLPSALITPVTHRAEQLSGVSELIKTKNKTNFIQALQLFDPGLKDVIILSSYRSNPTLEIEHEKFSTTVPVSAFGDGMRRALAYAAAIPKARNGILLMDEIETAVHISALRDLYAWLIKVCAAFGIQLFVTTHSLEAVDALLSVHGATFEGLVAYQLGQVGQQPKRISGELLNRLRNERGLDVR